jgi:acetyl-CoA carboxylase biotin carboxylase subunit
MKLFIANRGEIALRIIRTCRKLGVHTVLAHSEADRESLPMRYADERYPLGGSTPAETYLNIPKLVKAARDTECDAVHPGYGFLSEDPNFVKACEENGLNFVGPSSRTLAKLGNKLQARSVMRECGVPIIPGSDGPLADEDDAVSVADKIGYPIIIKAVYGGGGRGMRIAREASEVHRFFRITRLEAASAFGRGEIYIEKRLMNPRHVEIQAIADNHGKLISLGERECSIQRRHQKLLEEAPSVALDEQLRHKLNDAAIRGLSTAGYTNAGTVEFLLEKSGAFYFLEVNKRLQVEHLVTELTTRLDIVEEQLNVAANAPLGMSQNEVRVAGWAINCRINAEDPREGFIPMPGTVIHYHPPTGPGVRIDSALFSGYSVPEYYDSLIAKLATWGTNRNEAIQRMRIALEETEIIGIPTTVPLHRELMRDDDFVHGSFDTTFLNGFVPRLTSTIASYERLAAVVAAVEKARSPRTWQADQRGRHSRWRNLARTHSFTGNYGAGQ